MKTREEILKKFYKLKGQKKMKSVIKEALSSSNTEEIVNNVLETIDNAILIAYRLGDMGDLVSIDENGNVK